VFTPPLHSNGYLIVACIFVAGMFLSSRCWAVGRFVTVSCILELTVPMFYAFGPLSLMWDDCTFRKKIHDVIWRKGRKGGKHLRVRNSLGEVAVTLYTCILEVLVSNLGPALSILEMVSCLSSIAPRKCRDSTSFRTQPPLPFKCFQIYHSSGILLLDVVWCEYWLRCNILLRARFACFYPRRWQCVIKHCPPRLFRLLLSSPVTVCYQTLTTARVSPASVLASDCAAKHCLPRVFRLLLSSQVTVCCQTLSTARVSLASILAGDSVLPNTVYRLCFACFSPPRWQCALKHRAGNGCFIVNFSHRDQICYKSTRLT
jgi:hypothetical protein